MIKLSYKDLQNNTLLTAFVKLNNAHLDAKTAYRISRVCKMGDSVLKKINDHQRTLLTELADKDEEGKLAMGPNGQVMFKDPANEQAFHSRLDKYLAENVAEIPIHPISFASIQDVQGLTGHEISALEPFVCDFPETA